MRCARIVSGVLAMALAVATSPAFCQESTSQPIQERGYISGFGGVSFTDVSSPFFGASVGASIGSYFQITGEAGHMGDVTAPFTNEDLKLLEQGMGDFGLNTTASTEVPATYFTAGVRWLLPTKTAVRPYAMGSGGIAMLKPAPKFSVNGTDLTSLIMAEDTFKTAFADENRPLASVGGGVTVDVNRHVVLDLAYRYSRIFIDKNYLQDTESPTHHSGININRVYAGLGYQF